MTDEFKNFSEIPYLPKQSAETVVDRQLYRSPPRELVVGGDIKWKPIDAVAARVIAPAPWHCKPPEPKPTMKPESTEQPRVRTARKLTEDGYVEELINKNDADYVVVDRQTKEAKETLEKSQELLKRAHDTYDAVAFLASSVRGPWDEYSEWVKKELEATRQTRFAIENETRLIMTQFKEVRQFFLGEDYEPQIKRLSEFVALCERLKALKDSGFLDTIADTILRLSEK